MASSTLVASAKAIAYVNGRAWAPVVSIRWDVSTPGRGIPGLDVSTDIELAPSSSRVNGSMVVLRQVGDGGVEGAGLIPFSKDLPAGTYFSLALVDRLTDTLLFRADRCWINSQSWDTPSRSFMVGTINFTALDWNNEAAG